MSMHMVVRRTGLEDYVDVNMCTQAFARIPGLLLFTRLEAIEAPKPKPAP
jgi:hypothetical protein